MRLPAPCGRFTQQVSLGPFHSINLSLSQLNVSANTLHSTNIPHPINCFIGINDSRPSLPDFNHFDIYSYIYISHLLFFLSLLNCLCFQFSCNSYSMYETRVEQSQTRKFSYWEVKLSQFSSLLIHLLSSCFDFTCTASAIDLFVDACHWWWCHVILAQMLFDWCQWFLFTLDITGRLLNQ